MAAGTTADDLRVEFRPIDVAVPSAGMVHDDALTSRREGEEGLAISGGVKKFPIYADDGDISFGEGGGGLVAIFGVINAVARRLQGGAIG